MRGKPFQEGPDERRNRKGRGPAASTTVRTLAKAERGNTVERLKVLRDQDEDLKVALEASKVLVAYSDGPPPTASEKDPDDDTAPLSEEERALVLLPGGAPTPQEKS